MSRGNRLRLLVGGAEFFPSLLAAIEASRRSVHLETYIFADDRIGRQVIDALAVAARRGVQVRLTVDGYGGGEFARKLVRLLGPHGVQVRIFRPERWWRLDRRLLRRLHRKLAVIDDRVAFVGGINIIDDLNHPDAGQGELGPRFDFAVRCEGPIVAAVAVAGRHLWWTLSMAGVVTGSALPQSPRARPAGPPRPFAFADGVMASLLLRDNLRNRRTIERAYTDAVRGARHDILIANAYFLPGRRFRTALRDAAARGVRVRLLLQGRIEYVLQHHAQHALYGQLLQAGIELYEYTPSYLHAKVAVVDADWATVGSSNIDPYSLLLAREANVVVRDRAFAQRLRAELEAAIGARSRPVQAAEYARRGWPIRALNWVAYGLVRLAVVTLARGRDYG
jgi:cardiolipin synthase